LETACIAGGGIGTVIVTAQKTAGCTGRIGTNADKQAIIWSRKKLELQFNGEFNVTFFMGL
jgi:hypothetical protein